MKPKTLSAPESSLAEFEGELEQLTQALPRRINADPEKVEQGLAKLVLTLIELLRKLLERQALRRIEQLSWLSRGRREFYAHCGVHGV